MGFWDWLGLRTKEAPRPADLRCTFCGKSGLEAQKIIAGPPPFFICDACIGAYSAAAREERAAFRDDCSFCGRTRRRVRGLYGGDTATICNDCLELCRDILEEETRRA